MMIKNHYWMHKEYCKTLSTRGAMLGRTQEEIVREDIIDLFIEKYNPNDPAKVNQWMPLPEPDPRTFSRRIMYLTQVQDKTLTDIANQRSNSLGRHISKGVIIASAISEYFRGDLFS